MGSIHPTSLAAVAVTATTVVAAVAAAQCGGKAQYGHRTGGWCEHRLFRDAIAYVCPAIIAPSAAKAKVIGIFLAIEGKTSRLYAALPRDDVQKAPPRAQRCFSLRK